jgi:hypothetical protein
MPWRPKCFFKSRDQPCDVLRCEGALLNKCAYCHELAYKRMEIFKEAAARARRIAVLRNAQNPLHDFLWDDIKPIGPVLG